jgi:signal transduction histidine kinase
MAVDLERLEAELAATAEPRRRVELLNELAWLLREEDLERAIELSHEAQRVAEGVDPPYDAGLARTSHQLGRFYMWLADFRGALDSFSTARALYEKLGDRKAATQQISYTGVAYGRSGNYAEALRHLIEAQEVLEDLGDPHLEAVGLNSIGYIYVLTGQPAEALPYLEQSWRTFRALADAGQQTWVLDSLCQAHLELKNYEQALAYGLESVALAQENEVHLGRVECLLSVGAVYLAMGKDPEALDYFQQAFEIAQVQQFRRESAKARERIGEVHRRQGRLEEALAELQQAAEVAGAIEDKELEAEAHHNLFLAYRQRGDYRQAVVHFEAFDLLNEAVFNEKADDRLKTLQVAYEAESARREAAIARSKNLALQEEIEERQRAERALQQTNVRLQEEIASHQELIADLDAFAHVVAHDLKNPIHTIAGYSEALQERLVEGQDALLGEFAGMIHETAFKMSHIIDTMLLLARMGKEEVAVELLEMGPIVEAAEQRLARMLRESGAEVAKPEIWPAVWGYAPWVEEVWENYLSNALKYGGRPPRVELGATRQTNGMVKFWVRDNGLGFSPRQADRLFKPFSQLQQKGRRGHGLGLSIVKRIVDKLGGEVGVTVTSGEGSTFYFTLPAAN